MAKGVCCRELNEKIVTTLTIQHVISQAFEVLVGGFCYFWAEPG